MAEQLGWPDTLEAEYVALTKLQAEALVTLDQEMAEAVLGVVETVAFAVLTEAGTSDFNSS